jgi:hypothetical protein
MGASRTMANKQRGGRKPGLLALARIDAPLSRVERMNTPRGSAPMDRFSRASKALLAQAAT